MCGRYVSPEIAEAERNFTVHLLHWQEYERSYNVAPTQRVPVVRLNDGQREGLSMRVPFFAKGIPPKYSTIITMPPNALMTEIHNAQQRMPAILAADQVETWLSGSAHDARAALKQYAADSMVAWPVSTRVNSPKNDDAELPRALPKAIAD